MRVFQDSLCDAPEQKAAHTRELAPANDDEFDALLVDEAQNLIQQYPRTVHAFSPNGIRQKVLRVGKYLICLFRCRTHNTLGQPRHITLVCALVKRGYVKKVYGRVQNACKYPRQSNGIQGLRRSVHRYENVRIFQMFLHHAPPPALFVVFIREILSNSFFIPTIIRSDEKKLTCPIENDRLTLHIM